MCEFFDGEMVKISEITVWEESFRANVKYNKDLKTACEKAHKIVDDMTLAGLNNLINKFE